ncbi:LOW QUALITY PROTEIN: cilia- and flagella-associated protein 68 [Phoenicopterus ruber ruber]
MSKICLYNSLHGSLMHATGHGELWMDWNSTYKFSQYGWRCTTNENYYATKTLMGNWKEGYDIQRIVQPKPLPSQYTHCFETTYSSDYNKGKHQRIKRFEEPHWFPGHHPELEPPSFNPTAQSYYTIDYTPPYSSIFLLMSNTQRKTRRKSNKDGDNLQTMPSEKQEACLLAVLQGYPSSKKTCHTLKPM